jgi:hypothetical protein
MSREIIATTAALALLLAASAPSFASKKATHHTPEQICAQQAKKEHVSKSKRHAFIESCVEKHKKSMEGAKEPASGASSMKESTGGASGMAPATTGPAGQ